MKRNAIALLALQILASAITVKAGQPARPTVVLVEAEGFAERGGWVVDPQFPQFMDQMGSPYLLAHGLGQPVAAVLAEHLQQPPVGNRSQKLLDGSKAGGCPASNRGLVTVICTSNLLKQVNEK